VGLEIDIACHSLLRPTEGRIAWVIAKGAGQTIARPPFVFAALVEGVPRSRPGVLEHRVAPRMSVAEPHPVYLPVLVVQPLLAGGVFAHEMSRVIAVAVVRDGTRPFDRETATG